MTALPTWWQWQPGGTFDTPLCSTRVVFNEHGQIVAAVLDLEGAWGFTITDGELTAECGGFGSEERAQRACERVYAAITGELSEEGG